MSVPKRRSVLQEIAALQDRAAATGYELSVTAEADGSWTYGIETKRFRGLPLHVGGGGTIADCLYAAELAVTRLPRLPANR